MNFIMSTMITLSMIMMFLYHPLSMGVILIMQTIIMSMIIGYMLTSFLFSYIIMIIMLSGALVLFIYMASVASNEKFQAPISMIYMGLFVMLLVLMLLQFNIMNIYIYELPYNNDIMALIKIFNMMTSQITLIMIIYLFMTMIVVSNVASTNKGPLRISK